MKGEKVKEGDRPILQVALDFVELERALRLAHEAVEGGADWLEAGTPLIKSEGLEAVRALKRAFPDHTIVADMKTMDAGRVEVETAAKAGAGVVDVLAAASDSTIAEAVAAARDYGTRILADLVSVPNPVERARQVAELGVHFIGVHTPIDLQMQGVDPFATLRELAQAVEVPLVAAGGINSETAAVAVAAGATVVIVGGAITKAPDAKLATHQIRQALDSGVAVPTRLFKRGTEAELREILRLISTANLSDALHRGGVLEGLQAIVPETKLVGAAFTVRTAPGDWSKPVQAIDHAKPGDVIVIEAGGVGPAVWGELATNSSLQRGLAGVVIDGQIRDVAEIRQLKFPAFARLHMPHAGEPRGLGEIGVPIKVAGVLIRPGDWLLGDDDGIVHLPQERAVEFANRGMEVLEKENRLRQEIQRGSTLGEALELLKWDKVG